MKKIIRMRSLLMVSTLIIFTFTSCFSSENKFIDVKSGESLLLSEETLVISHSFSPKAEKDGYIPGVKLSVNVKGYDELSYWGTLTLKWDYEYLGEDKEYVPASFSTTIELDATGSGKYNNTLEISNCRAIRNETLTITYDGSAVKK